MEKKLTITITEDNKLHMEAQGPLTYPELVQASFSVLAHFADKTIAAVDEADAESVRNEIYDMINIAASNTLYLIAPDLELRPDLTAQAILKAENELLDAVQ